jgi:hypothetical protein
MSGSSSGNKMRRVTSRHKKQLREMLKGFDILNDREAQNISQSECLDHNGQDGCGRKWPRNIGLGLHIDEHHFMSICHYSIILK